MKSNQEIMQKFTLKNIPSLDTCVLAALELFQEAKLPKTNVPKDNILIAGSGNAVATAKIVFPNAQSADESSIDQKLKTLKNIKTVVLFSASGKKHAPIIAKKAKQAKKQVILITNNKNAPAKEFADQTYLFPKNKEPYTYNTSTYLGPILGLTKEDPKAILKHIKTNTDKVNLPNFKQYKKYYLIIPTEFVGIIRLLNIKFIELFGRKIARDIETFEYIKHATTVVSDDKELFISFGKENKIFGKPENRLHIPLPKDANYASMMAISYYIIGKIQSAHPQWFKNNIEQYCKDISKVFKQEIKPIVE